MALVTRLEPGTDRGFVITTRRKVAVGLGFSLAGWALLIYVALGLIHIIGGVQ